MNYKNRDLDQKDTVRFGVRTYIDDLKRQNIMHDPNQMPHMHPVQHPAPGFDPNNPAGAPYMASMPGMAGPVSVPMEQPIAMPIDNGGKKKKNKNGDANAVQFDPLAMDNLSPDQVTQMQVEQAIRESQNPGMRLRKLRSPLSVRSCLLNLLFFIILTLIIVFLVVAFSNWGVERFNFGVTVRSMWYQFGLQGFFRRVGDWFANLFTGCGSSTYHPTYPYPAP